MKKTFLLIFILEIFIGLTIVIGSDDDDNLEKEESKAEMDSYVDSGDPTSNYGGMDYLKVGEFFGFYITYIYFNFEDAPDDWEEVEISFDMYYVSETMEVSIYLVPSTWEELTINWINRPKTGSLITKFTIASKGSYDFDVSDLVEDLLDDDEEGFSICLNTSYTSTGDLSIYSEEGAYDDEDVPLLIWSYELIPGFDYDWIILIVILSVIASVLIALYFTIWRKKPTQMFGVKPLVASTQPSRVQASPPLPTPQFCWNCGTKITLNAPFCTSCGERITF